MPRVTWDQEKVDQIVAAIMNSWDIEELRVKGAQLGAAIQARPNSINDFAVIAQKISELFGGVNETLTSVAEDISEGADMTVEARKAMAQILDDVVVFEGFTGSLLEMVDGKVFEWLLEKAFEAADEHLNEPDAA